MSSELVEALAEAIGALLPGLNLFEIDDQARTIAGHGDLALPLLARFASPAAKREALRILLEERLKQVTVKTGPLRGLLPISPEFGTASWYTVNEVLLCLAPEVHP